MRGEPHPEITGGGDYTRIREKLGMNRGGVLARYRLTFLQEPDSFEIQNDHDSHATYEEVVNLAVLE